MVRWVSKSQRINSGMDSDTGKRHTSRPPPHPSHVLRHFSAPIEVQRNVLVEKHFGLFHTNNSFISEDGVTSDKLSCSDFLQIFPNNKSLIILYGKHCVSAWLLLLSSLHAVFGNMTACGTWLLQWVIASGCHHMPAGSSDICIPDAFRAHCLKSLSGK